jgi:hypothetical protein
VSLPEQLSHELCSKEQHGPAREPRTGSVVKHCTVLRQDITKTFSSRPAQSAADIGLILSFSMLGKTLVGSHYLIRERTILCLANGVWTTAPTSRDKR